MVLAMLGEWAILYYLWLGDSDLWMLETQIIPIFFQIVQQVEIQEDSTERLCNMTHQFKIPF